MTPVRKISIGQFEFDCRVAGDEGNEAIILLHGFPETSVMWSRLMDQLSSKGYYCLAPDLRGYSANACPKGVKNYKLQNLSEDILQIADKAGITKFHLIGHDWGAIIGWDLVYNNPQRIFSWSALSVPHLKAFAKAFRTDPEQKKRSRYIGLFKLPIIAEIMLRRNDFRGFRKLWKHSSQEEVEEYLLVFRRKKSLTAALNYYRANIGKGKAPPTGDITTPTLYIWGNRDLALSRTAAEGNSKYMKGDYTFLEVNGGHWLIQSNYDECSRAIEDHLTKYKSIVDE